MKLLLLICLFAVSCAPPKENALSKEYRGRLVIKGICAHYVVEVLDESVSEASVAASWHDNATGRNYKNVFTVRNFCSFPNEIKEGDLFNFRFIPTEKEDCVRCMAYVEVPDKNASIDVVRLLK